MSSTEPLTRVRVRGRHMFIPLSLTGIACKSRPAEEEDGDDGEPPSAEEMRALHEMLAAVVWSATSQLGADELGGCGDAGGTAAAQCDSHTPATRSDGCAVAQKGECAVAPADAAALNGGAIHVGPSGVMGRLAAHAPRAPPGWGSATAGPSIRTHALACAVAVVLLSCAWLRRAREH